MDPLRDTTPSIDWPRPMPEPILDTVTIEEEALALKHAWETGDRADFQLRTRLGEGLRALRGRFRETPSTFSEAAIDALRVLATALKGSIDGIDLHTVLKGAFG